MVRWFGWTFGALAAVSMIGCAVEEGPASTPSMGIPDAATVSDEVEGNHGHEHGDHEHGDHDHDHGDHDHEGHDHAGHDHDNATIASLVGEMEPIQSQIETAFTDGDPHDAHDALHQIGHLIEDLKGAAERQGLDGQPMSDVLEASEGLMDAYDQLDAGMHGGEAVGYDAVADDIDAAMAKLRSVTEG